MGLFSRIKKAFTGKEKNPDKEEQKPVETKKTTETPTEEQSTQTEEKATPSPKENQDTIDDVKTPEPTEPVTKEESQQVPAENNSTEQVVPDDEIKTEGSETESEVTKSKIETPEAKAEESESKSEESVTESTDAEAQVQQAESENSIDSDNATSEAPAEEKTADDEVEEYDQGLKKSRKSFSERFNHFLANFRSVDEEFFDDLEELLIESDVGYETAMRISDELREEVKLKNVKKRSDVSDVIVEKLVDMYDEEGKEEDNSLHFSTDKTPTVFLFVGVNGAGKTTTIGKLAHRFQAQGKKVLLAAGDTFRAGAIEQLQEWGKRVNVPVEAKAAQTDPASVVYDAVQRAINEDFDILLVDTAGRLQNKQNLMRELEKIKRVITRELPDAPQEVLLVLDGSTGQNALSQAKQFNETTNVSGIVLTKIDGSSQGGIVLAIRNELHLPVKLVGLGEQMDDLRDFDAEKFIYGLFKDLIINSGE